MHTKPSSDARDYAGVVSRLRPATDRRAAMRQAVDALWDGLHARGISWVGFYVQGEVPDQLILGPCRDKPACSPIGLHGVCGRSFAERRPVIVRDVGALGASYIACDPRDRSEVVLPLLEADGMCWGVLDVDSHDVAAFDQRDVDGLARLLAVLEITCLAESLLNDTLHL
jgi:putative methionine-R-sulfoxide reductase with GAF domain